MQKKNILFWKSNVNMHIFFRSDINICSMNILLQRHDMDTERGSISGNVIKALADYLVPFFLQNQWNSSFEKVLAGDFCGRNLCVAVGSFNRVDVFICEECTTTKGTPTIFGQGPQNHKPGPYLRQGRSKQGDTPKINK